MKYRVRVGWDWSDYLYMNTAYAQVLNKQVTRRYRVGTYKYHRCVLAELYWDR
jgi:hypothetical protein